MTIEQLVGMSADQLEAMTLAEKEEFFRPYLQFIRPDPQQEKQKFEKWEKKADKLGFKKSSTNHILEQGQALLLEMEKRMKAQ